MYERRSEIKGRQVGNVTSVNGFCALMSSDAADSKSRCTGMQVASASSKGIVAGEMMFQNRPSLGEINRKV